jgi:hypothetical protein
MGGLGVSAAWALAAAIGHATSPDIGCYQAHHRLLTGRIAVPLAAGLILLAAGIYLMVISWPLPSGLDFKGALFPILIGSALAVPYVFMSSCLPGGSRSAPNARSGSALRPQPIPGRALPEVPGRSGD